MIWCIPQRATRKLRQPGSSCFPWSWSVTSFAVVKWLLTHPDCVDLLFRLNTSSRSPRLHRLLCPPQRAATWFNAQQQTHQPALRSRGTGDNPHGQSRATNISHFITVERLRDFVTCIRLPRRSSGPTKLTTTLWTRCSICITDKPNNKYGSTYGRNGG